MQKTSILTAVGCALALGACVTTGQQSSSSSETKLEPVKLATCGKPIATINLQLATDFAQRLHDLGDVPPANYVEDVVRRSNCFQLIRGKADYTVVVSVDASKDLPYNSLGLLGVGAALFMPLVPVIGIAAGTGIAGNSIARIDATVTQEVVFPGGRYERLTTKTDPTYANSGYIIPNATQANWEKTPEGKALGLAQIRATNDLIDFIKGHKVAKK